jgi:hypothetical protein
MRLKSTGPTGALVNRFTLLAPTLITGWGLNFVTYTEVLLLLQEPLGPSHRFLIYFIARDRMTML